MLGRESYLYLDVALDRKIEDEAIYTQWLLGRPWLTDNKHSEDEFADKVCIDWMDRRKQLGETLDEKEDPKIIPTYEAHSENQIACSRSHRMAKRCR